MDDDAREAARNYLAEFGTTEDQYPVVRRDESGRRRVTTWDEVLESYARALIECAMAERYL